MNTHLYEVPSMTVDEHLNTTDEMIRVFKDIAAGTGRLVTQEEARRFGVWILVTEKAARTTMGVA